MANKNFKKDRIEFDIVVIKVMVNLGSSFEQLVLVYTFLMLHDYTTTFSFKAVMSAFALKMLNGFYPMWEWWSFVCLFVLLLYVPSQQLWSLRDGQFTKPHFFLGKLEQAVNKYFVHILSLVTDNNAS